MHFGTADYKPILIFLGAFSSFPLYLFCGYLRFATAATKKDAASIWARKVSRKLRFRDQYIVNNNIKKQTFKYFESLFLYKRISSITHYL